MAARRPTERAYDIIREAPESNQFAWWEWDIRANVVTASRRKVEMIGYDHDDFAAAGYEAYTNLLHPEDYERTMDAMRAHLEGRAALYQVDYRIRARDGAYVWYMDRGAVVQRGTESEPLVLRGVVLNLGRKLHDAARDDAVVAEVRRALPGSGEEPILICAQCGRLGYGSDEWIEVDQELELGFNGQVSHTLCPDCIRLLYPQAAQQILARLRASR